MKRDSIKLTIFLVVIIIGISGCKKLSSTEIPEKIATTHIERAEDYRRQGQYRAAIIEARNAIDTAPGEIRGRIELATLLNDLGQGKQALHILEPLQNNTNKAFVLVRADALLEQGKFRSALEFLQAHADDDVEVRFRIAQAQAGLNQADAAQTAFGALLSSPRAGDAQLQLARLNFELGNKENGEVLLQQLLQKDPNDIDALMLSAQQAESIGALNRAEELLSRALLNLPQTDILTPQKIAVLQQLMPILTKLGRSSESLIYAKVLADANPEGAILQSKFKQGVEAFQAGKLAEAESLLHEIYEQTHDDYAGILLGMIKYDQKDYTDAAAYLGENIDPEITPDAALKVLANAEMHLRQPDKLLELIGPEERAHIKDPELKALIGIALVQSGSSTQGEKMLLDALHDNPNNSAVRATLARHYVIINQMAKATATLEEGLAQNAKDEGLQRLLVGTYVVAGKSEAALQTARKLAAARPEQAVNYYVLGHTAFSARQYDIAESALQKALTLQADYVPALIDLAQLHLIRNQPQAAIAIYQRLLTANGDNSNALKGFITAQEMLGVKADDNDIEKQVLQLADTDTARAVIAEYYLRHQHRDDANRLLAPIKVVPGDSYPAFVKQLYALAEAGSLLQTNNLNRARQVVFEGLQLNPRNSSLLILLGHIEIQAGANNEATKIIEQLAQVEPNSPALADLRGTLAWAAGDSATAARQFRTLWEDAKNDQVANKLYQALAKSDSAVAAQFLNEWQTALPDSDSPLLLRGVLSQRNDKPEEAQKFYEAALKRNDKNALALNNLALLYADKGDKRSLPLAEKAYTLQPNNPAVLDTYGWLLSRSSEKAAAIKILRQAKQIAPQSTEIESHLQQAETATN
ncbi:MAG TPA: tetratricopeptide repeat protein [Spongiibacteraceae bacterium]